MACLLLACATLTARALDRTFLEGNDVTVDKLTSLSALDVSKMITPSSLDNNGLTASVGVRRNQNLLHGMTFTHDGATGNLLERTGMFSYGEEFAYDDLDRLTSYTGQGGTKYITYEDNGNIQSHTDLGDYEYSQVKPHAVETVGGLLPGLQSAEGSTFTYNGFGKVSSINFSGMSQMSWRRLDFSYGPDRERWKTVRTMRGGLIPGPITTLAIPESSVNYVHTTNLYAGDYERIDGTSYYYLDGGVIYVKPATGAGQAYYALTDHLGSYTRLYTMAGDSVLIASYDPWGNCTTTKNTLSFRRGFTGHEHLTTYGVINMRSAQRDALLAKNGRMYDPTVGRYLAPRLGIWLSPDPMQLKYPHVSSYAYCMGNLVKLTDLFGLAPGDFFRTVNAAAVDFGLFYNYNSISASSKEMVDDIIRDSLRQAQEPSATSSGTIGDKLRNHRRQAQKPSPIPVQTIPDRCSAPTEKVLQRMRQHLTKMRRIVLFIGLSDGEVMKKHLTRDLTNAPTIHLHLPRICF